jgi:hypothetical protein
MDLYGPVKVGGDILAFCGKCKTDLAHVIVALMGGKPVKVICKTCKSEHKYRLSGDSAPRSRSLGALKPARAPKTFVKNSDYWEQKMASKKQVPLKPYRTQELFQLGDVISHSKFGVGIVEEVKSNGKILVLFRDEERTLIHGISSAPSAV